MFSPQLQPYVSLLLVFLAVAALIGLFSFAFWFYPMGPARVRSAVRRRMSPSEMQSYFKAKLGNLLVFALLGAIAAAGVCFLSLSFGQWDYEPEREGTWAQFFGRYLGIDPFRRIQSEDTYESAICFGVGVAVLAGFVAGGVTGKILGMKAAVRRYHITKALL